MFLKFNTLLATHYYQSQLAIFEAYCHLTFEVVQFQTIPTLSSRFETVVPLFVAVLVLSYCPIWTKGSQWGLSPEIVKAIVMLLFHYLLYMILQQLHLTVLFSTF